MLRLARFLGHVAYFHSMQALVADSTPSECVVLFNTELFALDEPPKPPRPDAALPA